MDERGRLLAATDALDNWAIDVSSVVEVSRSENVVFRVEDRSGKRFVLRLHRPGYHTFAELESEQQWTHALTSAGIDVPIPTRTRRGEGYAKVAFGDETRYAGVLEWVDGEAMWTLIEKDADTQTAIRNFSSLGTLMAAMHEQATQWTTPQGFTRHILDEHGLMGSAPFWGRFWEAPALSVTQRARFEGFRARIFDLLVDYAKDKNVFSLIHADLHPGNIVVHEDQLHVIDFDDAGFGWHVYDMAVALKNFQDRDDFARLQMALIEGYRRVRSVDDETIARLPLFLLIRALATIGWISARPDLSSGDYVHRMIDYAERHADAVLGNS